MTSKEIFLSTFLFVAGFITTEILVSGLSIQNPAYKFLFRIIFLAQYSILIYLIFDYLENKSMKEDSENCPDDKPENVAGDLDNMADITERSENPDTDKKENTLHNTSAAAGMIRLD